MAGKPPENGQFFSKTRTFVAGGMGCAGLFRWFFAFESEGSQGRVGQC